MTTARERGIEAAYNARYQSGTPLIEVRANAVSDVWGSLLRALVENGYLVTSDEMGDSWCFFCDGMYHGSPAIFSKFDEGKMHHTDDCAYIRAKEALDG